MNVLAKFFGGIVIGWLMCVVGWVWSIVGFILYLVKDTPFNWTSVWIWGIGLVLLIVSYIYGAIKAS